MINESDMLVLAARLALDRTADAGAVVRWWKVEAHSGLRLNERADTLADVGARGATRANPLELLPRLQLRSQ